MFSPHPTLPPTRTHAPRYPLEIDPTHPPLTPHNAHVSHTASHPTPCIPHSTHIFPTAQVLQNTWHPPGAAPAGEQAAPSNDPPPPLATPAHSALANARLTLPNHNPRYRHSHNQSRPTCRQ